MQLKIISAGAGSGKTYRLTKEMVDLLRQGVRAEGIIATTFTQKAAAELQERVRVRLLEEGLAQQAEDLTNALIGTVHGLGVKLLKRFAYEAGVSPDVSIIAEEDQQALFNQSLSMVVGETRAERMQELCERFGITTDWRADVRKLTEVARLNNFSTAVLAESRDSSYATLEGFFEPLNEISPAQVYAQLSHLIEETVTTLRNNGDSTKVTSEAATKLEGFQREIRLKGTLPWPKWAELYKIQPGSKSKAAMEGLREFAAKHTGFPEFRQDIRGFISEIFNLAIAAIEEFQQYKQKRGLIDYTDMEALVNRLLDNDAVREVLEAELDLLLVDEFQDTSPLQLELFLKLSRLARYSIWVGDPKQSIYGFRGAAPALMQAIIDEVGGIRTEDIQRDSWRSREDLVYAANAIFTKAFSSTPADQVALNPKRTRDLDPVALEDPLFLWKFEFQPAEDDENKRVPGKAWVSACIASSLADFLERKVYVIPKGEKQPRPARPGDVAILCRSNAECQQMAEALHQAGLEVSIARAGLLETAEASLIIACLKYLLHYQDTLSIAEILLLAEQLPIEDIIAHRFNYLDGYVNRTVSGRWAQQSKSIAALDALRPRVAELSSSETLDVLLGTLDLRRIVASWGNAGQRLDNIEVLRSLALQYEEACNRLQTAASLGGFLLWINSLSARERDYQSFGESPNAVHVLTYHKSKGLEWPIVICHNLDNELRLDVWGIDIIPDSPKVDLNNLLGGRKVRYWVNPYGGQYAKTPLYEAIQASSVFTQKRVQALEEENRLLYVGLTRARDYMVFPMGSKAPTKWLNRAWHAGQEELPVLDPDQSETPWEWSNRYVQIQILNREFPREIASKTAAEIPVKFIEKPLGNQDYAPRFIELRRDKHPVSAAASINRFTPYLTGVTLDLEDMETAQLLSGFLLAYHPEYPSTEQVYLAEQFLGSYVVSNPIEPQLLLNVGMAWDNWLNSTFPKYTALERYPLFYNVADRIFETTIDLLLETESEIIAFNFALYAGEWQQLHAKAQELSNWCAWTRAGLQQIYPKKSIRTFIHFVPQQTVVEVGLNG